MFHDALVSFAERRAISMEQMTITAKVQIVATDADKVLLDETMSVYRDACNYVSEYSKLMI